jgi:hypothetical protein
VLRDGLFSSVEFVEVSREFTLLRLKPGPAEARFGITAAPMAAVADWHGRVTIPRLNLRGDIKGACTRLRSVLTGFDRRKASRPPYRAPDWAQPLLRPDAAAALGKFLERVHPRRGRTRAKPPGFGDLVEVYERIEIEGERIPFCENLITALVARAPKYGTEFPGYEDEVTLLREMTYCGNDRIKFAAIKAWAGFAPVSDMAFLKKRADEKTKNALNPNVVLCRCMEAVGILAKRFPGLDRKGTVADRARIVDILPTLVEVLDTEGRNNGACRYAKASIEAIVEVTGATEALEAYVHNLKAPGAKSEWMTKINDRYHKEAVAWLEERTGQRFGTDFDAWRKWYAKNRKSLCYRPRRKAFVVDAAAARKFREKLADPGYR